MPLVTVSRAAMLITALAASALLPRATEASGIVFYRCVAADGSVTLQNGRRCPKGMREERRVMEVATSRAPPAALEPVVAPPPPVDVPAPPAPVPVPVVEIPPGPAPALFACRTWDDRRYFGEVEQPAPRCAPLATVGIDRRSETSAQACETRYDDCEPVAEDARCAAWAQRLRDAESAARFGEPAAAEAAGTEAARIRTLLAATICQ